MNPKKHPHRKSPRLKYYDYAQNGAYFVTICTQNRANLFGYVDKDGVMQLNDFGRIAHQCWENIPEHFSNIELDLFIIMPNHMHGILFLSEISKSNEINVGERHASPLRKASQPYRNYRVKSGSLISVVGSYKSAVTKQINKKRNQTGTSIWQRSFHDHVIRNEIELTKLREYVLYNASLWAEDKYYSDS